MRNVEEYLSKPTKMICSIKVEDHVRDLQEIFDVLKESPLSRKQRIWH